MGRSPSAPPGVLCSRSANSEEADFFRIKAWNSQAEAAGDHLGKGRRIAVEGSLRQDVYEKDGEERKAVSVVARRLEYL
ncbi:MAG: single-stranded DNA-binding protein [Armatimonadetes bacterium]|nr:single-stranded DNA-binding protein [Armatimonadota bacterium]